MTNEIFWRYEFDYSLHAFEVWVHEVGRIIREWAGCQNFRFGPERENLFLLTSPFIERIKFRVEATAIKSNIRPAEKSFGRFEAEAGICFHRNSHDRIPIAVKQLPAVPRP